METLYVNRILCCILVFILSLLLFNQIHNVAIDYIYENPTTQYDLLGELSEKDKADAMKLTEQDNYFLDKLKGKKLTLDQIKAELKYSKYYEGATDKDIQDGAERIQEKLKVVNKEYLSWFELLIAFGLGLCGYFAPLWMLMFQKILRKLEIENKSKSTLEIYTKRSNAIPNNYINAYEN